MSLLNETMRVSTKNPKMAREVERIETTGLRYQIS